MINFVKADNAKDFPFGYVEVKYPEKTDEKAFYDMAKRTVEKLKAEYADYDRKLIFGENPYVRFFKKFKKTYPVLMQFESVLLKDRPFPEYNAITGVSFLAELTTHTLSGSHDADCCEGEITLYISDSKEDFPGMRGEMIHTYPGDFCAKDEKGIILSEIAGADERTFIRDTTTHVFYPVFSTPDGDKERMKQACEKIIEYAKVLSPDAECEYFIL